MKWLLIIQENAYSFTLLFFPPKSHTCTVDDSTLLHGVFVRMLKSMPQSLYSAQCAICKPENTTSLLLSFPLQTSNINLTYIVMGKKWTVFY